MPHQSLSSGLLSEVREPLRLHDVSHAQAFSSERRLERSSRVCILDVGPGHSDIDQGYDPPELGRGGQSRVAADRGSGLSGGVEVLLGGHELGRAGEDLRVVAQGGDDLVCEQELGGC